MIKKFRYMLTFFTLCQIFLLCINPVLAISYVDLERTVTGQLVGGQEDLGKTDIGGSTASRGGGRKLGSRFTASATGEVFRIRCYFDYSSNAYSYACIYNDTDGAPDGLLAYSSNVLKPSGAQWHEWDISLNISSGTVYWLFGHGGASYTYYYDAGETNQSATAYDPYPPNDPCGSVGYYDRECSIYVTLNATPSYGQYIAVSNLEPNYSVKLLNSTNGLVTNATANSQGIANMTLPGAYRSATFEGSYRIYDSNASFVYSKWFEDVAGGDQYEAKTNIGSYSLAIIGLVLALFGLVLAVSRFT